MGVPRVDKRCRKPLERDRTMMKPKPRPVDGWQPCPVCGWLFIPTNERQINCDDCLINLVEPEETSAV